MYGATTIPESIPGSITKSHGALRLRRNGTLNTGFPIDGVAVSVVQERDYDIEMLDLKNDADGESIVGPEGRTKIARLNV